VRLWNHAAFIENGRAGAIKTAPGSNTTSIKNSTYQKIATAIVAIGRRLINYRGKTRTLTTTPRCLRSLDHFWREVFADVICGAAVPIAKNVTTCAATFRRLAVPGAGNRRGGQLRFASPSHHCLICRVHRPKE
jgi:hypothetical protein